MLILSSHYPVTAPGRRMYGTSLLSAELCVDSGAYNTHQLFCASNIVLLSSWCTCIGSDILLVLRATCCDASTGGLHAHHPSRPCRHSPCQPASSCSAFVRLKVFDVRLSVSTCIRTYVSNRIPCMCTCTCARAHACVYSPHASRAGGELRPSIRRPKRSNAAAHGRYR